MGRFVLRRLLQAVPTLIGITLLTFAVSRLAPGDPLTQIVVNVPNLTVEQQEELRRAYGLDQPLPVQYLHWAGRAIRGDFGNSFQTRQPVLQVIGSTLPNTLQLSVAALLVSLAVGIPLGVLAARMRGSWLDQAVRVFGVAGHAIPTFWFGLMFILVLGVQLRWFPVTGQLAVGADPWDLGDRFVHLVGPVLALSLGPIANFSRFMRTEMLDVVGQDYIRTARAKGVAEPGVLFLHGLRNALLPVITAVGGVLAGLVSGSVVVERVFSWPGMGRLAFDAASNKDYPVVMGVVVISSVVLLASYILRDVAYGIADPRVSHG